LAPYFHAPDKFVLSLFGVGVDVCSVFLWFRSGNSRCRYPCIVSLLLTTYMFINAWTDFTATTVR
ncbi:MAG: hypothetical protein KDA36_09105, partial [Planctomycetaceae bacterium]|nr:hypothetical protein [Planctomycetaceae bacterium]